MAFHESYALRNSRQEGSMDTTGSSPGSTATRVNNFIITFLTYLPMKRKQKQSKRSYPQSCRCAMYQEGVGIEREGEMKEATWMLHWRPLWLCLSTYNYFDMAASERMHSGNEGRSCFSQGVRGEVIFGLQLRIPPA